MHKTIGTDRRSFLKAGAIVAAPVAALAPVAAIAADDSSAQLARLEDERAIEALQRKFLRHLNGSADCSEFLAASDAVDLDQGVRAIAEDMAHEPELVLADDGLSAAARCACHIERVTDITGNSTIEQMARLQGHGTHSHREERVLATEFRKGKDGWRITKAVLA